MNISLYRILTICIASVWLVNGIYAKILGFVPRHELIAERILQTQKPKTFILIIGIAEIFMAIWILSGKYSKNNAIFQAFIIIVMNILEFIFARELLLWGKWNLGFSCLFVALILWNEFYLNKNDKS